MLIVSGSTNFACPTICNVYIKANYMKNNDVGYNFIVNHIIILLLFIVILANRTITTLTSNRIFIMGSLSSEGAEPGDSDCATFDPKNKTAD